MPASKRAPCVTPFKGLIQACAALAAVLGLAFSSCSDSPGQPANLLLISIDTLRADHLGAYGRVEAATPNLDRLAARGVVFPAAFTPVPVTLPAHASLLTGLLPVHHGVRNNSFDRLDPSHISLAGVLKGQGFHTAAVVGSSVLDHRFGLDQGFDSYDDQIGQDLSEVLIAERSARQVADLSLSWLDRQRTAQRFFLWVHFFDPHDPYRAPGSLGGKTPYDQEISYVDQQLGRILQELEGRNLLDTTLVAVVSDHGEGLGEHQELTHGIFLYDSTLRIPWILAGPGIPPGWGAPSDPVSLVDVMPTLLRLLGAPQPEGLDGIDLLTPGHRDRPYLYAETFLPRDFYGWSELRALRNRSEKFISAPRPEYYRLDQDPNELNDLSASSTDDLRRLSALLESQFPDRGRNPLREIDPDLLGRIQSLGYVGMSAAGNDSGQPRPDPKDRIELVQRMDDALAAGRAGQTPESVRILREILAQDPGNFLAWHNLADRLFELRQADAAFEAYGKALELGPDRAYYHYRRALCLEQLKRFDEAARSFENLLQRDSNAAEEILQRSDALASAGNLKAASSYLAAVRKSGYLGPPLSTRELRLLVATGDWEAALPASQAALRESPSDPQLRQVRAEVLQNVAGHRGESGALEEAVRLFEEATLLDPTRFDLFANLGITHLRLDNLDAALQALLKALELAPEQTRLLNLCGEIYLRKGNGTAAVQMFERSRSIDPNQPQLGGLLERARSLPR